MSGQPSTNDARRARRWPALVLLLAVTLAGSGCAARTAYRKGQAESEKGNWDMAVARLTKAVQLKPSNVGYRIALENARIRASRHHAELGRRHMAAGAWEQAADELQIASNYDQSNKSVAEDLVIVRDRVRRAEEERRRLTDYETLKAEANAAPIPVPVLSPRSAVPITLKFTDVSLQKIFETLSKLSGVNIVFDTDYRDKKWTVDLSNVTFEQALDQLTFVNRLFYNVLDQNTIIIVPETPAKRRTYEQVLLRTFYIENADIKELEQVLKTTLGTQPKIVSNPTLNAINIIGTPDELTLAQRIVAGNDKSRGEVMIELQILEVDRARAKEWGLNIATNAGLAFAPNGAAPPSNPQTVNPGGLIDIRGYLLSSMNLADFVVSIPSTVFAQFLQTDSNSRILATPRLRAAEGKKTVLKIGQEVPVPVTTFGAGGTGGAGGFQPATSFQYRNVGINMEITPRVNPNGDVTLELDTEFSLQGPPVPVEGAGNLPTFSTRRVNGVLRLRDGETALIGGLLQETETESLRSILGVLNVPILNKLLPATRKTKRDNEILMSITPHLLRAPKVIDTDLVSLPVGTRETFKVRGARPSLFGPEPVAPLAPTRSGGISGPPAGSTRGPAATAPAGAGATPRDVPAPTPTPIPTPSPAVTGDVAVRPMTTEPVISPLTASPTNPYPVAGPTPVPPPNPATQTPQVFPTPAPEPTPFPVSPQGGGSASATLTPASSRVQATQSAPVSLVAMEVTNLTDVELVLSYDSNVLDAVDAVPGPLLTLDGAAVASEKEMEPGRIRAHFTRPTGVSGSGVLATVTFRALRSGSSAITTEVLQLTSQPGGDQVLSTSAVRVEVQ